MADFASTDSARRAGIYARVSTARQENENQLAQLRDFAARSGWTVAGEWTDEEGGGQPGRAGFLAMMDAASRRGFDVLLVWSLDRFSREGARQTIAHLTRLDGWGVGFRSLQEAYLDTTGVFRDALVALLAALAQQERVRLSERVRAGLQRARAGGRMGGRPKSLAAAQESEARALLASGLSVRAVAARLGVGKSIVHRAGVAGRSPG